MPNRIWCGLCGTYGYEGKPFPCNSKNPTVEDKMKNCALIGAPFETVDEQEEEQMDLFMDYRPTLPENATELPENPSRYGERLHPLETQIAGDHYKKMKIQPIEYILANELQACEANIVKYATRWKYKGGIKDIDKIIHYAQILKEWALENGYDNA